MHDLRDDEIIALAKGMAPFVREYVDRAILKSMVVSSEVATQIANAVRLLHEEKPAERNEALPQRTLPRITRVERDEQGNFVPVYGEPQA